MEINPGTNQVGVTSLNSLTDDVILMAGANITLQTLGNAIIVNASGGTIGPGTTNEIAYFNSSSTISSLTTTTYPSLTELSYVKDVTSTIQTQLNNKQTTLVSGTNIKTINSTSLLGSGDIAISGFAWGATGTGTSGNGITLTAGSGASADTTGLNIAINNTTTDTTYGIQVALGTSYSTIGMMIKGSPGIALKLWQNETANTDQTAISIGTGTSYGARLKILQNGHVIQSPLATDATSASTTIYQMTIGNSRASGVAGFNVTMGNTQANVNSAHVMDIGTSAKTQGLLIKGTGSTVGGDVGTGKNHLTLWGNTAANANKVLSVGNAVSYAENLAILGTGLLSVYGGVATTGWGVPAIYGSARSTAQTGDVASVTTYTCGASDGSFMISCNANCTAYTAGVMAIQCTYTDETNTARTLVLSTSNITGTIGTSFGTTGAFEGLPLHIRVKASTAITIKTVGTAFTGTYNVEGIITQIA